MPRSRSRSRSPDRRRRAEPRHSRRRAGRSPSRDRSSRRDQDTRRRETEREHRSRSRERHGSGALDPVGGGVSQPRPVERKTAKQVWRTRTAYLFLEAVDLAYLSVGLHGNPELARRWAQLREQFSAEITFQAGVLANDPAFELVPGPTPRYRPVGSGNPAETSSGLVRAEVDVEHNVVVGSAGPQGDGSGGGLDVGDFSAIQEIGGAPPPSLPPPPVLHQDDPVPRRTHASDARDQERRDQDALVYQAAYSRYGSGFVHYDTPGEVFLQDAGVIPGRLIRPYGHHGLLFTHDRYADPEAFESAAQQRNAQRYARVPLSDGIVTLPSSVAGNRFAWSELQLEAARRWHRTMLMSIELVPVQEQLRVREALLGRVGEFFRVQQPGRFGARAAWPPHARDAYITPTGFHEFSVPHVPLSGLAALAVNERYGPHEGNWRVRQLYPEWRRMARPLPVAFNPDARFCYVALSRRNADGSTVKCDPWVRWMYPGNLEIYDPGYSHEYLRNIEAYLAHQTDDHPFSRALMGRDLPPHHVFFSLLRLLAFMPLLPEDGVLFRDDAYAMFSQTDLGRDYRTGFRSPSLVLRFAGHHVAWWPINPPTRRDSGSGILALYHLESNLFIFGNAQILHDAQP